MNNSSGFQTNPLLGSSAGFKKRALLRPASGMLKKQEYLKAVDISQSQPAIATLLRSEVASIDQQINLLDKDKKLRQGQGGLQKSYVTTLRKWLRQNQNGQKEDDEMKILKQMGVQSYEAGFRKLWKIACNLDLVINKATQLQIVHFLLYDEMFQEVAKESQKSLNMLTSLSNHGYCSATFQITQILLDRSKDVYSICKKGGMNSSLKLKQENRAKQQASELVQQLKKQNSRLTNLLQKMTQQKVRTQAQKQNLRSQQTESFSNSNIQFKQGFKQIQQQYKQRMKYLSSQKQRSDQIITDLMTKIGTLQSLIKSNEAIANISSNTTPKSGSYQEALIDEMDKMKRGFEKKISILTQQFTTRQKDLRKKQAQHRFENQRIKWQKCLLLKKFQLIPEK